MQTSRQQTLLFTEAELTSLPEAFHASHTATPENGSEKKMSAISGPRCLEQFGKFSRVGLWAKTFAALLIGMEGWSSTRCRLNWKLRATKSSRFYFQLAVSTLRIGGNESGLLPTPTVMDYAGITNLRKASNLETGGRHAVRLTHLLGAGLLPTPVASNARNGATSIENGRMQRKITQGWTIELHDLARMGMLPTPTARDYRGANKTESHSGQLPNHLKFRVGINGQLNPRFVGEMMGFPANWTELPFLNGEPNQSKPSETP